MHEYSITESLIALVLEEGERVKAEKVRSINLVIGELSTILPDCIKMYFEVIAKGTILEDAQLNFKEIKAELKCNLCGEIFSKNKNRYECPECGGLGVFTEKGKEFYIESIEIEDFKG
jgi:hydrogenase nickel incorporation protein HypA/HybF